MKELRELTKNYLLTNGLKEKYFASWCGLSSAQVSTWLSGRRALPDKARERVLQFVSGAHYVPLDKIGGGNNETR